MLAPSIYYVFGFLIIAGIILDKMGNTFYRRALRLGDVRRRVCPAVCYQRLVRRLGVRPVAQQLVGRDARQRQTLPPSAL